MLPPQAPGRVLPTSSISGDSRRPWAGDRVPPVCLRLHVASPLGLRLLFCLSSGHCHWMQGHPHPVRHIQRSQWDMHLGGHSIHPSTVVSVFFQSSGGRKRGSESPSACWTPEGRPPALPTPHPLGLQSHHLLAPPSPRRAGSGLFPSLVHFLQCVKCQNSAVLGKSLASEDLRFWLPRRPRAGSPSSSQSSRASGWIPVQEVLR